jgi:hypothetical protein
MTRPVQCVDEQALGEVLALPQDDPRRRHLADCPRCRALVLSYQQFLDPTVEESASYGTAEHDQLSGFRHRMLGLAPAEARAPMAEPAQNGADRRSWGERLFGPSLRPVWAIVAIAIAFGVMKISPRPEHTTPEPPTLRGAAPHELAVHPPVFADSAVTLAWASNPEADAYQLRFFSIALTEIGRHDMGRDTVAKLAAADLPEPYRAGEVVLWRVVALKGGDELESSAPGSLKQP